MGRSINMANYVANFARILSLGGQAIALGSLTLAMGAGGAIAQESQEMRRPRPAFFEESRRDSRAGFSDTFLGDALNGRADPLGGSGAAGTGSDTTAVTNAVSQPRGRSAAPAVSVDRTRVIIPNADGVRSQGTR